MFTIVPAYYAISPNNRPILLVSSQRFSLHLSPKKIIFGTQNKFQSSKDDCLKLPLSVINLMLLDSREILMREMNII